MLAGWVAGLGAGHNAEPIPIEQFAATVHHIVDTERPVAE